MPTKVCVVCNRPFTWRKKWEDCWDEVTTCSKTCNAERKKANRIARGAAAAAGGDAMDVTDAGMSSDSGDEAPEGRRAARKAAKARGRGPRMAEVIFDAATEVTDAAGASSDSGEDSVAAVDDAKAARKAARKAAKAEKRAKREGRAPEAGQKACDLCEKRVDLLIRCQISNDNAWTMVCGKCWKTPAVAGGVVDGDGSNPHYRYGGLWKNLHRATG